MLSFKPVFHSPLSPSSRGSLIPLYFLPLGWYHLHTECCFLFSGGEEPGLWRFLSPSEGGLCAVPPLLGPYPRPLWFYQVIYPLKEIYPDSGELGPLGTCPPSHCSFSACWGGPPPGCWFLVGSRPPPSLTGYCFRVCTLTSPCSVCPLQRRDTHGRKGRITSFPGPSLVY